MFLVELTRVDPHWAEWKETDVASVRCDMHRGPCKKDQSLQKYSDGWRKSDACPRKTFLEGVEIELLTSGRQPMED